MIVEEKRYKLNFNVSEKGVFIPLKLLIPSTAGYLRCLQLKQKSCLQM